MRALDYLMGLPYLPMSIEGKCQEATKAEVRRWCRAKSVLINGAFVDEMQEIPGYCDGIWQLIFFPGNPKRTCHMVQNLNVCAL